MTRLLSDASAIIALARVGELGLLRQLVGEVHVTPEVMEELLHPDHAESEAVRAAAGAGWLRMVKQAAAGEELRRFGLDAGEASLFAAAGPEDVLLLDDRPARRLAEARGQRHTGLLGLLVRAVEDGALERERGLEVLDKLAAGTFHMSVELYQRARARIERG